MSKALQLVKKANGAYKKAKETESSLFKDASKVIERYIETGEYLEQAKLKAEDDGENFKDILKNNCDITERQAIKYRRIAKHKAHTRALLRAANEQGIMLSVNKIVAEIPKLTDDVVETKASVSADVIVDKEDKRDKNDWHTPTWVLDAAREVMGSINLDPFSSVQANARVNADLFYTEAVNALEKDWDTVETVWMNPPYSNGMANKCVDKFLEERSKFDQAIVLMNAATDTQWFLKMRLAATAVCMTTGRIAFEDAGGKKVSGNTKGQVFFYFGENGGTFCKVFKKIGWVVAGGDCHE